VSISSEAVIIGDIGEYSGEDDIEEHEGSSSFYSTSGSQSFRVGDDDGEGEVYTEDEEGEESLSYHEEVKSSEEVYNNEVHQHLR
jgi:hypothetical protein